MAAPDIDDACSICGRTKAEHDAWRNWTHVFTVETLETVTRYWASGTVTLKRT